MSYSIAHLFIFNWHISICNVVSFWGTHYSSFSASLLFASRDRLKRLRKYLNHIMSGQVKPRFLSQGSIHRDILPRRRQWILMSGGDAPICEALSPPESNRIADLPSHHLLGCGLSSDAATCESYMSLHITPCTSMVL